MRYNSMFFRIVSLLAVLISSLAANATAEDQTETYTGFVINKSRDAMNNSSTVRLTIERWSTDEERTALLSALAKDGHEGFVKALQGQQETGFVRSEAAANTVGGLPSIRTLYARKVTDSGTTTITVVTARPMRAKEDPEYKKYNVSALRLELPEEGKGTGIVYVALQVTYDEEKQRLLLRSATRAPLHLTNMRLNE
jgi:hypothetical protein